MVNQRIQKLRQALQVDKYPLCIEKVRLTTQSYQETEGEPAILRRAKALATVLDGITIFIEDAELIVGNAASKPMGVEIAFGAGTWPQEEIDGLKKEGWAISESAESEIRRMNEYWKPRTLTARLGQVFDDERLWPFVQSGIYLPPWKSREEGSGGGGATGGMGLEPGAAKIVVDYAMVLERGLGGLIQEAQAELSAMRFTHADSVKKADFLKAVILAHRAIIGFANRFADHAQELARLEANTVRRSELERIAATCRQVPEHPARSFYEAVQSFWFIFLMLNPSTTTGIGRFDRYMYPYYRRDKDEGKITDGQVLELLESLRIKDMQLNFTGGRGRRDKWAGMAKWHNMVIGGQTPDGRDATNELTYLVLEAAKDCPTPHHTITLRVHDGTPETLMLKALEVVRTGIGLPAFIGDKSYVEYLLAQGVPLALARDYALAGSLDTNLMGKSRAGVYQLFVAPLVFDIFMHNGVEPRTGKQLGPRTGELEDFESFDDLLHAFQAQLAYFMGLTAEYNNIAMRVRTELIPQPVSSPLMTNGIKEGRDLLDRTFPFENGGVLDPVGMINIADSLAAIKKLIFEDRRVTMKELKAALAANWHGRENLREMFLAAPKFGNDDDYVDSIARELYQFWADTTVTFPTALGGKHKPSAVSIAAYLPGGALTGATPDGRYAGECLADGTMSPMRGRDMHGPAAVVKSAAKVDQVPYQSTLLTMKFHPSAWKSADDLRRVSDMIRSYFASGGKHIEFNVVSRETLLEAQRDPEKHRDLIVRVAGYSAYFVQLSKVMQDEIIARTEHARTAVMKLAQCAPSATR